MRQIIAKDGRCRRRRRRCHRWPSEAKARYLEAFQRSGASVWAFCDEMDLSPITFTQWLRDARRPAGKPTRAEASASTFARVTVMSPTAPSTAIRLVVRGVAGHEAALDGVDAPTAIQIVALMLEPRR